MSFGSFIRGIAAQVNPFDKGKTYGSYNPSKKKKQDEQNQARTSQPTQDNQTEDQGQLQVKPITPQNLFAGLQNNLKLPSAPKADIQVQKNPNLTTLLPPQPGTVVKPQPLQVRVAAPQNLQVGNKVIVPSPQARTAPPVVQQPHASIFHNFTHNPITNIIGNIAKPTAQLPVQFSENYSNTFANLGNRLGGGRNQTIQQNMGGTPLLNKTLRLSGATGQNKQLAGDVAQIGLTALPGAGRGASLLTKTGIGAGLGAGFNASAIAGGGGTPRQIGVGALQGAAMGAALPVTGRVVKVGGKVAVKAAQEAQPLNELGAVGKNVGKGEPKPAPQIPLLPQTSPELGQQIQSRSVPTSLESQAISSSPNIVSPNVKTRGFVKSAQESKLVSDTAKANIDGTYEVKANADLANRAAIRISADPVKAHDFAIRTKSDEGTATAIALAQQYRKAGNHDLEASLINEKARRLTEAGREVQAASMLDKLSPEGVVASTAQTIQKYNETAKKPIPELTGDIAKQFGDKAAAISQMAEGRDKSIAIYKLKEDAANLIPSSRADKFVTVWKAGLLTSPRTTMRNIVGNAVHGAAELAKSPIASVNDMLLSLKTGKREVTSTLRGTLSGTAKGARAAKDIATMGFDPESSIAKYNINHITWGNNPLEQGLKKYTNIVFRNMGAQDKVFYHSSFARSLYDQAGAEAKNAGKGGDSAFIKNLVDNPTERMKVNATKDAQLAVFQNSSAGSRIASSIKREAKSIPGLNPVTNIVMPFTGVPSSIAGQMIAYSPVGLTKALAKDAKVFAGKVTKDNLPDFQRQASQEIGRGVIGTGLLGVGAYLTAQGLMTGNPKDANEARQWELEGKQPNSVMIDGKWRSINSIGPEALVLLAGSKIEQGKKNGDGAGAIAGQIGKDFTQQTFLQGVQGPLNAITDPQRYGSTYVKGQAASVIPNIVKDAAKASDPFQRETNSPGDALKAGIPGLRNNLLPKRDALGNPLKQEPSGAAAFVDLFNSKTPIKNPVVDELSRLYAADQSATPSKLKAGQKILGQDIKLTPKELDQLEQDTGQPIKEQFSQLMSTPEYKGASDEIKKKALDSIVQDVRSQAKLNIAQSSTGGDSGKTTSKVDVTKLTKDAKLTLAKDSFDKSGKSYQVVGDTVLRRDAEGKITATPKIKFDYQIGTATLTKQKNADDLGGWLKTAQGQLDSIDKQLQDPSIDPLEALKLENDAQAIVNNMAKYKGYGGFTKPKSGGADGKGGKQLDTSFGTLKAGTGAPSVQQYASIDTKSGSVPHISVVRPNIIHRITSSG